MQVQQAMHTASTGFANDRSSLLNCIAQVPGHWNSTTVPFRQHVCIHQLFEQQAAAAPDAECLVYEGTSLTYGQLDRRTNQLACYLQSLGVGREVPVAVLMERSLDLIVAVMGR